MARAEWEKTTRFIELALDILEKQQPMTIRQLYYQMLGLPLDSKLWISILCSIAVSPGIPKPQLRVKAPGRKKFYRVVQRCRRLTLLRHSGFGHVTNTSHLGPEVVGYRVP